MPEPAAGRSEGGHYAREQPKATGVDGMRVLAYTDSGIFSGAESVFAAVCGDLARSKHSLTLAAPAENRALREALVEACGGGVELLDVPAQPTTLAAVWLWSPLRLLRLRRILRCEDWDCMIVNLPSFEYGGLPVLAKGRGGPPVVGLVHVHHSPREEGFRLGLMRERLAQPLVRRFDHLHVASPIAAAEIRRSWGVPPERVSALPLPLPRVAIHDPVEARRRLDLPLGAPVVCLIGRISLRQKGHDVLLAAAGAILSARPDVLFAIAGEGADRTVFEDEIARRGLAKSFRFLGSLKPADLALAACDMVVIPSRFEGLPLVALEALAAGRPGIASDVDGLRVLWPAPWRVPPDRPDALAEAVLALLSAPREVIEKHLEAGRAELGRLTSETPAQAVLATAERLVAATV